MLRRAFFVLTRDIPVGILLAGGLWASVRFMIAMLAMFDPARVPQ